jgi:tetratricopeptide (TPR) repeat protein
MNNVLDGKGTFTYYLDEYNKNNHSAEILASLAKKYQAKGDFDNSLRIYQELLQTSNISKTHFEDAKYNIGILSINNNNLNPIKEFLTNYPEYKNTEDAVYALLNYYKSNQMESEEIDLYTQYLNQFKNSHSFLNSYAWRMSELNKNLNNALGAINKALKLINKNRPEYPNILDTKAEVLWKLGKTNEAIEIINEAIKMDSSSDYYKTQKNKFINS